MDITRQERQIWKKPHEGVVKINWDATLDNLNKKMGVRLIARDAEGFVLASMCTTLSFIPYPTITKVDVVA